MTPTNQLLLSAVDMLGVVANRLEALGGAKPGAPSFMTRPTTAAQRAEERAEALAMEDLVAEVQAAQARQAALEAG